MPEQPAIPSAQADSGSLIEARRRQVIEAMRVLAQLSREVTVLFDRLDLAMTRSVGALEQGDLTAVELARSTNLPGRREAFNEAALRIRTAQHVMLRALFRLAEAEGVTKTEVARTWRVSRQLVSRMIKESD